MKKVYKRTTDGKKNGNKANDAQNTSFFYLVSEQLFFNHAVCCAVSELSNNHEICNSMFYCLIYFAEMSENVETVAQCNAKYFCVLF